MLSLQEMSDRLEIQDLLTRYCYAIDDADFEALDSIFTPDAMIDYTESGGAKGTIAEIKRWLPIALAGPIPRYQHMISTSEIKLVGDRATSRTILFNPLVYPRAEGADQVFFIGLWYRDELVRTAGGWRISSRYEEMAYSHNVPENLPPAPGIPPAK